MLNKHKMASTESYKIEGLKKRFIIIILPLLIILLTNGTPVEAQEGGLDFAPPTPREERLDKGLLQLEKPLPITLEVIWEIINSYFYSGSIHIPTHIYYRPPVDLGFSIDDSGLLSVQYSSHVEQGSRELRDYALNLLSWIGYGETSEEVDLDITGVSVVIEKGHNSQNSTIEFTFYNSDEDSVLTIDIDSNPNNSDGYRWTADIWTLTNNETETINIEPSENYSLPPLPPTTTSYSHIFENGYSQAVPFPNGIIDISMPPNSEGGEPYTLSVTRLIDGRFDVYNNRTGVMITCTVQELENNYGLAPYISPNGFWWGLRASDQ